MRATKKLLATLLIIAIAVMGFSIAGVVSVASAQAASEPAGLTNTVRVAVTNGPLETVDTASVGPVTSTASNFTITADPSAFEPTATIELTIGLSAPSLLSVEQDVNNPGSPAYRQYLSYAETNSLGASPATVSALTSYLESYGLTISGSPIALNVQGTVTDVQEALHTTIGAFQETYSGAAWNPTYDRVTGFNTTTQQLVYTAEPRVFYSDTTPIQVPASLASAISGISGLNGLIAEPQISAPLATTVGVMLSAAGESTYTPTDPNVSSTSAGGAASVNLVTGAANYTYNDTYLGSGLNGSTENLQLFFPSTMPTLYGALPLWTGSGTINGARDYGQGITIAVVEEGCIAPSILESFSNATFGSASQLMGRLTYIALGSTRLGSLNPSLFNSSSCVDQGTGTWSPGWTIETAADVEYSATMAPEAHIDLLSVPSADFTAFDAAYQFAAEYLIGQIQCSIPSVGPYLSAGAGFPAYDNVFVYGSTIDQYGGSACDASIFSNSYAAGEQVLLYTGAPMYLQVQNELLEQMAAEGGTSFFASGDTGSVNDNLLSDLSPADSPAVTSVGGGQISAASGQGEFPSTNVSSILSDYAEYNCVFYDYVPTCTPYYTYGLPVTVAPVTESASFTYWAGTQGGTYDGEGAAGGFGQSMSTQQAWWQNGLDTYSVGARIDPTVSGQAALNMTVWYSQCYYWFASSGIVNCQGPYAFVYGGTSFSTPLMAGDLALVEEQLQLKFGEHDLGDVNALLYTAHNAYEAGATPIDAFEPMVNIGCAYGLPMPDWCYSNNAAWYYYNMTDQTPMDQGQPPWFATLDNPAVPPGWVDGNQLGGSSLWNYLQGLGLPQASLLDKVLVGQTSTDHALTAEPFYVEEVGPSGTLEPITTLTGGVTDTFEIVTTLQGNTFYGVTAYSGGANNGTYGGGTTSSPSLSSTLTFTYTPIWTNPRDAGYEINATTYGYFLVSATTGGFSPPWTFQAFAVAPPVATGNLQICIDDIYGVCQTGSAEETMFWAYDMIEWYNIQGPTTLVTLNGQPIESAVVQQVSVYTNFCSMAEVSDCTMNPLYYAQGQPVGTYLTDARGTMLPWMNAWTAENNGSVLPETFTLTAYLDGVVSNTVMVYVEPQSGSFYLNDLTLDSNGLITGTVDLNSMTNLEWANISLVPAPGTTLYADQYLNESFTGVNNAAMTVSLNTKELPAGTPAIVTATAKGWNNLSIMDMFCSWGSCSYYNYTDVQNPMIWQDPAVFLPASVALSADGVVTGTDRVSWSGANYPGAVGTLSLVSAAGSTVLTTGISGSYALDTTTLLDGYYSVVFTETAPGAVTTVRSVSFYADNVLAQLEAALAADATTITSLEAQVASIQASLSAANATIASLQSKIASLQGQVSTLQGQLTSAQSTIATLQAENGVNASEVTKLQSNVTADLTEIASLQSEVQTLQNELNAKKNSVGPAWYDTLGSEGVVALIVVAAIVVGVGAYLGGRRAGRMSTVRSGLRKDLQDLTPTEQIGNPIGEGPVSPKS